jgi:hypothetical protein
MVSHKPQVRNEKKLSGLVLNVFLKRTPFSRAIVPRCSSVASEPRMNIAKEISIHAGKLVSSQNYKLSIFSEIN